MTAKIMVVDDEPGIRRLLISLLEDEGYEVVSTGDGKKAVELATSEQPDLVITDLMLPGADGKEVVRQLETYISARKVPVILMSAAFRVASMDEVPNVAALMPKPFEVDGLLETIQRLLPREAGV